jgi:uncharacterized protein with NRDE domain
MCLLVMAFGLDPEAPLLVAANRDERLDRRATPMTVLSPGAPGVGPRILGGRDEEAGGTWLAVNDHGVVAGLTNRPLPGGRDPAKRSRGALPLLLARHRTAAEAVEDFVDSVSPHDYNPAWFLLGDRRSLFALDLATGDRPTAVALDPGLHILENSPLGAPSWKVDQVRSLLGPPSELVGPAALEKLRSVLADHTIPNQPGPGGPLPSDPPTAASGSVGPEGRRPETWAACVHTDDYGTRSATLISVPRDENVPPKVLFAQGHPCTSAFLDATGLWTGEAVGPGQTLRRSETT